MFPSKPLRFKKVCSSWMLTYNIRQKMQKWNKFWNSMIITHRGFVIKLRNICNVVFNLLKTKRRPLYLKTQSVPRCKHFSSRLQNPISLWRKWHQVAVCSQINTKHINTVWFGQSVQLLNVKSVRASRNQ